MKRTKQILFILIALFAFSFQKADAQTQKRELGIRLTGLNNFDFIYKKQKAKNKFIRYRVGLANIGYGRTPTDNIVSVEAGLAVGIEKRKEIAEKLYFIHGIEPFFRFRYDQRGSQYMLALSPSLGYVLGFQYNLAKNVYINMETIPSINTNLLINNDGFNKNFTINAGFNSNLVALSLVYQFKKKGKK